jgi:hypothetical protein
VYIPRKAWFILLVYEIYGFLYILKVLVVYLCCSNRRYYNDVKGLWFNGSFQDVAMVVVIITVINELRGLNISLWQIEEADIPYKMQKIILDA